MVEAPVRPSLAGESHSPWGEDGVHYPCEGEREVPLSTAGLALIVYLYTALANLFRDREDFLIGADQFLYYRPGDVRFRIAPDIYAFPGSPPRPLRTSIRLWEEPGKLEFVAEISSLGSGPRDRTDKRRLYQDELKVREYFLYDEPAKRLQLLRLNAAGEYQPVRPDEEGHFYSEVLDVWFAPDPDLLVRLFGPDGRPLSNPSELADQAEHWERIALRREEALEAEQERAEAERERAEAERERAEAAERRLAEANARAEALEAQLAALLTQRNSTPPES